MRSSSLLSAIVFLVLSASWLPSVARADGFRNPFQDPAAIGQGNAFRAQADNPSAIHYNPAGMTQLRGLQNSVSVQFVSPHTTFTSPAGVRVENEIEGGLVGLPPPGQFFLTANLGDLGASSFEGAVVGLGVINLFGFANEYPKDSPLRNSITRAQFPLLDIKPTVAYRVTDRLSIGLGADIFTFASFLGEGQAERQSIALGNIPGTTAGDKLELNGTGTTAGLNASFLYALLQTPSGKPRMNVGLTWRSQAVLPLEGALLANGQKVADATSATRFPEAYEAGLAVWPIRNARREWKLEVDVDYLRWSSIRDFDVSLSNGVVLRNPQDWDDAVTVGVGTEYTWLAPALHPSWDYTIRAGYQRSQAAVPDKNFDPAFPDSDVTLISVGLGFTCGEGGYFLGLVRCVEPGEGIFQRAGMVADLAYMAILFEPRTVTGSPVPGVNGTYKTRTHVGTFSLRLIF